MDNPVARLSDYELARRYYGGDHRTKLNAREKEYLQASGIPYCENYCETIVDTHAARVAVRGFGSDVEELATFARDVWEANQMDAQQSVIHRGAIKLKDYFVVVEPPEIDRDGKPTGLPKIAPNEPDCFKIVYDSGEPLYAVKVWTTERKSRMNTQGRKVRRMNIYWPDAIEYWWTPASNDGIWGAWIEDEGAEGNVKPWTMDGTPDGEPIGLNAFHFADRPDPHYGTLLLRGVIPQQDGLNKSLIDLFWVMDAQGWPQQWGSGVTASQIKRHPGSLWTTEKDNARFGQLDPADPERSIAKIESDLRRMGARAHMPLHLMLAGGVLPSGESLKTSESGLVTVTRTDRQAPWGHKYAEVIRMAARVENAFGLTEPPLEGRLTTRWERAETRQEVDEANTAVLWKTLGVSETTILSRLGFDPIEERANREREIGRAGAADELFARAREMQDQNGTTPAGITPQAPIRSETTGGGEQPAQRPANRVVRT